MKNLKKITGVLAALMIMLTGCRTEDTPAGSLPEGAIAVRLTANDMEQSDPESQIHQIKGFRFEEGILQETFDYMAPNEEGLYHLQPLRMKGTVYFLTNSEAILKKQEIQAGKTRLEDFLKMEAGIQAMADGGLSMTGQIDLSASMPAVNQVSMQRSMARLDIECLLEGVKIYGITVADMVTTGFIYPQTEASIPESARPEKLSETFVQPLEKVKQCWKYVCEQEADKHEVEMTVKVGENWRKMRTTLPAIRRNTVYTLKVYGDGATLGVSVDTDEGWENGNASDTELQRRGLVDEANSQLSDGVRISETRDTVFVPFTGSDFRLALLGDAATEVTVNGSAENVTIVPESPARALEQVASFRISTLKKMPATRRNEYIYLDVHQGNVYTGRVVLVFEPNPVELTGKITFDLNGECDFGKYIDGELGVLSVPEGMTARLEFGTGEDQWMKLEQQGTTYRILGGWKPNDPKADGRTQTARLICGKADGSQEETYIITRVNWGLPVVNIGGTWWCKYNLRGNVKQFDDQILLEDEPQGNLADYLKSCTDEQFLNLLGDQYQAGNPDGLKLAYNGSGFHYPEFQDQTADFGSLDPTAMAPDGYEVPGYETFRSLTKGDNNEYRYGKGSYDNGQGKQFNYEVVERKAKFLGADYGSINFYDLEHEGAHLFMLGLGYQSGTQIETNAKVKILFATSGKAGKSWIFSGVANRGSTWIAYANHKANETRTIRCIKTPVEYIY